MFRRLTATALAVAVVSLVACGSEDKDSSTQGGDTCATITPDVLTIGTGSPAYSPWVENDAPESGEGFEAAVALAVAAELGYEGDAVQWVRTTFDEAIAPGAKNFDFNLQQYSITPERSETISFSDPYYSSNQAIVALNANVPEGPLTIGDLTEVKFGVQAGTTSLDFVNEVIKPSNEVFVYDDNAGAKAALEAGQIDAIVVDLPTALYISYVEIEGTSVVGQFPAAAGGTSDDFGMVFEKDSDLVACVNTALAAIKASGALATIEQTWLSDNTGVPVITLD
ncbi:MAG: amino acid ABC transporter substrate-binding protein [Ilumatobacteraceae bacterium]|nr:amino acid ABC transporter substrate-binding protein [Ilumatobacteraceae bacterium]